MAQVTSYGQLLTRTESHELQHHVSRQEGLVFQAQNTYASVSNTTQTLLHIENNNSDKRMVVSFIRIQGIALAGGSALPSVNTYFQIGFGQTYVSGGTLLTPINMNSSSGNTAGVTAYGSAPVVTGTFNEFDRWYVESNAKMMTYNKLGSLILGKDNTVSIRLVTDSTSGTAFARITFFLMEIM